MKKKPTVNKRKPVSIQSVPVRILIGLILEAIRGSRNLGRAGIKFIAGLKGSGLKLKEGFQLPEISLGKGSKNIVVKLPKSHLSPTEAKDETMIFMKMGEELSKVEPDEDNLQIFDLDGFFRELG